MELMRVLSKNWIELATLDLRRYGNPGKPPDCGRGLSAGTPKEQSFHPAISARYLGVDEPAGTEYHEYFTKGEGAIG